MEAYQRQHRGGGAPVASVEGDGTQASGSLSPLLLILVDGCQVLADDGHLLLERNHAGLQLGKGVSGHSLVQLGGQVLQDLSKVLEDLSRDDEGGVLRHHVIDEGIEILSLLRREDFVQQISVLSDFGLLIAHRRDPIQLRHRAHCFYAASPIRRIDRLREKTQAQPKMNSFCGLIFL